MSDLSPKARAFLSAHKRDGEPSAGDAARVRTALAAKLAIAPAAGLSVPKLAPKLTLLKGGGVATIAMLVGVAAVVGITKQVRSARAHRVIPVAAAVPAQTLPVVEVPTAPVAPVPVPTAEPAPSRVESPPEIAVAVAPRPAPRPVVQAPLVPSVPERTVPEAAPTVAPAVVEAVEAPVAPPPVPPSAPPLAAAPTLEDELRLIGEAQEHLRRHAPNQALTVLDRWEVDFAKSGQLGPEAHAARIVALCELGEIEAGRAELQRHRLELDGSPHLHRVERACSLAGVGK